MLIDENGVDHGFCISKFFHGGVKTELLTNVSGHSESIAEKVKVWMDDIMELHQ